MPTITVDATGDMPRPLLAAAYVRMSTEHQQYSTENQLDTIKLYAAAHAMQITRVYTDAGKSGFYWKAAMP